MARCIFSVRSLAVFSLRAAALIRRDNVILLRQSRNQIPKHVGRCRKAVQQQHGRCVLWTGLAVEDIEVVDLDRAVQHVRRRSLRLIGFDRHSTRDDRGQSHRDSGIME